MIGYSASNVDLLLCALAMEISTCDIVVLLVIHTCIDGYAN